MTDKERTYRGYAGGSLLKAAERAFKDGEVWYIRHAIKDAEMWLASIERMEAEREAAEEAARILAAYPELADVA